MRDEVRAFALEYLGTERVIVAIDETSFPKREEHLAGVKKQYCGITGQMQHYQVEVGPGFVRKSIIEQERSKIRRMKSFKKRHKSGFSIPFMHFSSEVLLLLPQPVGL
jgi:SRSO17 transposase